MATIKEFLLKTPFNSYFCGWSESGHAKVTRFKALAIRLTAQDAKKIMGRVTSYGFTQVPAP